MEPSDYIPITVSRIWKGKQTLEVFSLERNEFGLIGGGIIQANNCGVRYKIIMDLSWKVLQVSIEMLSSPGLSFQLIRGLGNSWFNESGRELKALQGAEEIDISLTPFTNTIVMRKMSFQHTKTVQVILISIPELCFKVVDQKYTIMDRETVKYENFSTNFSSLLNVDDLGFVVNYPGMFNSLF